ncbi:hypothetical protein MM239_04465 [Belliella sp. DSM 111904]|uniref:Lipoprotein n=1 Tax=Belliella filtrata TaxID=2923435 RepID=A0ABS9UWS7_9BACT|nr:hypothetical protein [Belliella filtrata]MCH7408637.1 hypothetical protein [Belliella filtrata]
MIRMLLMLIVFGLFSCNAKTEFKPEYLRHIGDIVTDSSLDDADFELCGEEDAVLQYFNFGDSDKYEGERIAIYDYFQEHYQPVSIDESGWIRVRFIVNCHWQTGRFRMIESDENYNERPFDKAISNQILELTKSLKGWIGYENEERGLDYYQYLVFKIKNGSIVEMLP